MTREDRAVSIIKDCQDILAEHLPPDGVDSKLTILRLLEILDGPRARAIIPNDATRFDQAIKDDAESGRLDDIEAEARADHSERQVTNSDDLCAHCGGPKAARNPTGECDHMYWPDLLTDEAKRANGYHPVRRIVWEK